MATRSSKLVRSATPQQPVGADLFPFRSTAELWLTGSFEAGGHVLVRDAGGEATFKLKPVEFAVLAILMMAARRVLKRKPWSAAGFLPAEHLATEFTRWSSTADRRRVIKYVHLLRQDFIAAWRKQTGLTSAKRWAFDLIEHDQSGYRASSPPGRLHLDVVRPRPLEISPAESKRKRLDIYLEPRDGQHS